MSPRTAATRTATVISGVLITGVALSGCGASADDAAPEERTFALSGKELTVDSDSSAIELVGGSGSGKEVKVTRWFDGWAVGGSAGVTWSMDGDTLKLRLHCRGISVGCDAKHRIEVPRGIAVHVKEKNGSVRARGFDSDLKIGTGNGSVDVRDTAGRLEVGTSNGRVTAEEGIRSRQVSVTSDNGSIRLGLQQVPDRVETRTGNGSTRIALPRAAYNVDAHAGNGHVGVDVPRDAASTHAVTARSSNGNLTVTAG
ncbi:DUF4097 family beta strand repeat-containing protein [Streptomyces morookaense]|uniref:DUF4097 family beta strand repeat-containing protein n=1 Tax=Streptomyces morookaense TaxID=1970 RepID=UPI0019B2FAD0|nr:DUF4097 family beta strand repeat-containing protein [Streptomyces morookaense]GHF43558.1 lipoprotein [Streptomyces morookaense]